MSDGARYKIDWMPDDLGAGIPRYLAIAAAIGKDIANGRLLPGDRLPPQRRLADHLGMDFTTVARAYVEAQNRGLVRSAVGRGTFVINPAVKSAPDKILAAVDFSMNLPPEPDNAALIAKMETGLAEVGQDIVSLLRYQSFGGSPVAKQAALRWLARRGIEPALERLFIAAGAHAALVSIFGIVAKPGEIILTEAITYPGARSIAAQLGIRLVGLTMDEHGVDPDGLRMICETTRPKALYLNPTLQNPTSLTMPAPRRLAIAEIARRFGLPIIEDDAYGFIAPQPPAPFAVLVPDLTWHIAGLSKCLGAGLRCAYVVAPDARAAWPFVASSRAATVMASPLTEALATRWIEDGTGDAIIHFIRNEAMARQAIARDSLAGVEFQSGLGSFSLWLKLPAPWTRSAFVGQMQSRGIGIVPSDAFVVAGDPPEAVRVCLGGPTKRSEMQAALAFMAHALVESPALTSGYL